MSDVMGLGPEKILIIRMVSVGEVAAIGVPALRYFKHKFPAAELHFLTYAQGQTLIQLAEPDCKVKILDTWPDDFFQAMDAFLGLAETIIGEAYNQIVNLDTTFMPCFLARFLQDAGEPVSGNYISMSIQQLIDKVRDQTLQAEYVNDSAVYMHSSFFAMSRWHTNWVQNSHLPEGGYPEFYLRQCCGFSNIEMDNLIQLPAAVNGVRAAQNQQVALCLSHSEDNYLYPHSQALRLALEAKGFTVWVEEGDETLSELFKHLSHSQLVVCKPSISKWLADSVACPTLLISGAIEPKLFMPDFATEPSAPCPIHSGQQLSQHSALLDNCLCDDPWQLADNIESIVLNLAEKCNDD